MLNNKKVNHLNFSTNLYKLYIYIDYIYIDI